ncbi:MAG: tetratricopeptide repeat protein [Clostridium sp.]|nr:tetratricopeptide repeat protein [Prevotella sp.]MCM1428181.1 tetratricopeptide repeat protein [Clostridium sp.]MCM1475912.1 tetratricopeptide repeat protein [Muribaculaceae bacterium]
MMMKFSKYITLLCLILASSLRICAVNTKLTEADSAYAHAEYDKAIEIWNGIATDEGVSANLYYNIGNASYKKGNSGEAVLAYLRALRLNPSLKEANDNLTYISGYVEDLNREELGKNKGNVTPDQPSFWQSLYTAVAVRHLSNTWAIWSVISFFLLLGCIAAYIWSDVVIVKKVGFFGGGITIFATIIFVVCAYVAADYHNSSRTGVIVQSRTSLQKSPRSSESLGTPLHGGTILNIDSIRTVGKQLWYYVRLNSDCKGWISSEDFKPVNDTPNQSR